MALLELLGVWTTGPRIEEVPKNTAAPIDFPRGTDGILNFTLVDSLGQLVDLDLTGADRLVLSVRQTFGDAPLFEVAATKTGYGTYQFSIASNRTIDYTGKLIYDVWATWVGAQQQVLAASYFNVTPRMRS